MLKLKITKQSLNRVLKDLKNSKIIKQTKDQNDSRRKLLYLDQQEKKFYKEIFESQKDVFLTLFKKFRLDSVLKFKEVLKK